MVDRSAGTLLLCGYYGEHNLGDDALLTVLLRDLPSGCRLWITAHDRQALGQLCPEARRVDRRSLQAVVAAVGRVDAVVLGGGSLLQDSTSLRSLIYYLVVITAARFRGRPVLLWGQGLGPLQRPIEPCPGPRPAAVVQQCQLARRSLVGAGPSLGATASDGGCALIRSGGFPRVHGGAGDAIVLCWRPTPLLDSAGWSRLLLALAAVAERLDAPVRWLAFHQHQDASLLPSLQEQRLVPDSLARRSSIIVPTTFDSVFEQVRTARLVIPMRLHALVLARLAGCPMAALSYDPKVAAAAEMAAIPWVSLDQLPNAATLEQQWCSQADLAPSPERIATIRREASRHGERLRQALAQI